MKNYQEGNQKHTINFSWPYESDLSKKINGLNVPLSSSKAPGCRLVCINVYSTDLMMAFSIILVWCSKLP